MIEKKKNEQNHTIPVVVENTQQQQQQQQQQQNNDTQVGHTENGEKFVCKNGEVVDLNAIANALADAENLGNFDDEDFDITLEEGDEDLLAGMDFSDDEEDNKNNNTNNNNDLQNKNQPLDWDAIGKQLEEAEEA